MKQLSCVFWYMSGVNIWMKYWATIIGNKSIGISLPWTNLQPFSPTIFLAKTSKYFIDYMWKLTKNEHNEPGKRFPGWLGLGQEPGNKLTVSQSVTRLSFAHFGTNINAVNVTVNTPNKKQLFNWSNKCQWKNIFPLFIDKMRNCGRLSWFPW